MDQIKRLHNHHKSKGKQTESKMTKNMQRKCHLFKANRFSKATGKNSARAGSNPEARAKAHADLDGAVYDVVKNVISFKLCLKASKPAGNEMHCSSWEYLSGSSMLFPE